MTLPFATIAPSRVEGQRRESDLAGMGEFLATIIQNRQQLAQQRERLGMERQRLESALEMDKLERKERLTKLEEQERINGARNVVTQSALPRLVSMPGGITPEAVEEIRMELIKTHGKEFGTHISQALNDGVAGLENIRAGIAQRRANVSEANVKEGTEKETIATAKTNLANAQQILRNNQIQNGLLELQRTRDPSRVNAAVNIWGQGGVTWGQARETAGLAPGGVPDDAKAPSTNAAGSAQTRALEPIAGMFKLGKTLVDAAGNTGLTDLSALRLTGKSQMLDLALNKLTSPSQRQQVQGFRMMGTAFGRYISGQQSTDREAVRLMNLVAILKSDDDDTRAQKRTVNDVIGIVIDAAASGEVTPTQGMDMIIAAATSNKMSSRALDIMRQQRADAARFERNQGRAGATSAPRDATQGDNIDALLNRNGFIARPTP